MQYHRARINNVRFGNYSLVTSPNFHYFMPIPFLLKIIIMKRTDLSEELEKLMYLLLFYKKISYLEFSI